MERDPERQKLRQLLWKRGVSMRDASVAIGRNKAYLQQYISRGMPAVLAYNDSEALGALLDCDPDELRHKTLPKRKPWKRKRPPAPGAVPLSPLTQIPEMEVEAAAGPGALNNEFAVEKARWHLPEGMIRHEGGARPEDLRILGVRGNSMEPEMREGDRVMVDTARRRPATGEMFVLWDGNGLVVKRIETAREDGPPRLRLISANPDYAPYTCLAGEAHIVGKVLWTLKRA